MLSPEGEDAKPQRGRRETAKERAQSRMRRMRNRKGPTKREAPQSSVFHEDERPGTTYGGQQNKKATANRGATDWLRPCSISN